MRATSLPPVFLLARKTVLKVPSPICSPRVYEARGRAEKTLRTLSDTGESWSRGEEGPGDCREGRAPWRGVKGEADRPPERVL